MALSLAAAGLCQPIDATVRKQLIGGIVKTLNDFYVYEEVAAKMGAALQAHENNSDYSSITGPKELAEALTRDLQFVSHDKHLRVISGTVRTSLNKTTNFGFEKTERLKGNIGYLDLRGFMPRSVAEATASAAMNALADTSALIIDLRNNGGGDPSMVALMCTYLFGKERVHLNDLYWRARNHTDEWWTDPEAPGIRYSKPVYLLTSKYTFSAAEEFAYNLKMLKRATLVGETTGGGAHPGGVHRLVEDFLLWVPEGRAINPISKTNWEGVGVQPDIAVPADNALDKAVETISQRLQSTSLTGPTTNPHITAPVSATTAATTNAK